MMKTVKDIVLVDMDGVIADFDAAFDLARVSRYPNRRLRPEGARKYQRIVDRYPEEYRADIYDVLSSSGFGKSMPEIQGALEGLRAMNLAGLQVYICTGPLTNYSNNVPEKYTWVEEHLGQHRETRRSFVVVCPGKSANSRIRTGGSAP